MDELGAKAKVAADAALVATPDDAAAVRAKIDALRIVGDSAAARALVSKVIANASQPETAYVLAAFDLGEPEPLWQTIVRAPAGGGAGRGERGRARAALVYALARSGDSGGARVELEKLSKLHASASAGVRAEGVRGEGAKQGARTTAARSDRWSISTRCRKNDRTRAWSRTPARRNAPGGAITTGDAKSLVFQANNALARRDYSRASQLYAAALDKNPNDSEAQGGLGDVAHAQNDLQGARASYAKAIAINGHYLSAQIGLGDVLLGVG